MRGRLVRRTWKADPALYAPARYRRACSYEAFIPDPVEGLQVDARTLARAEANQDTGRRIGSEAAEILGNIDAMQLAIERASAARGVTVPAMVEIHETLMSRAPNREVAGRVQDS